MASNPTFPREQDGAALENRTPEPQGVIRRNLKMQVYLGIAVLFIIATTVSSLRHKPVAKQQGQPPAPMLQDSSANIEEMRKSLESQQRQSTAPRLEGVPPATDPTLASQQYPPADISAAYNCVPGQPCPPAQQPGYAQYQQQLSPEQQEQMQIDQQERALAYKARFSSNLAYSQSHAIDAPSSRGVVDCRCWVSRLFRISSMFAAESCSIGAGGWPCCFAAGLCRSELTAVATMNRTAMPR